MAKAIKSSEDQYEALLARMTAENKARIAALTTNQEEIEWEAVALARATKKTIYRQSDESTMHRVGTRIFQISPALSTALREQGYAVGSELAFTMVQDKCKALDKARQAAAKAAAKLAS